MGGATLGSTPPCLAALPGSLLGFGCRDRPARVRARPWALEERGFLHWQPEDTRASAPVLCPVPFLCPAGCWELGRHHAEAQTLGTAEGTSLLQNPYAVLEDSGAPGGATETSFIVIENMNVT